MMMIIIIITDDECVRATREKASAGRKEEKGLAVCLVSSRICGWTTVLFIRSLLRSRRRRRRIKI